MAEALGRLRNSAALHGADMAGRGGVCARVSGTHFLPFPTGSLHPRAQEYRPGLSTIIRDSVGAPTSPRELALSPEAPSGADTHEAMKLPVQARKTVSEKALKHTLGFVFSPSRKSTSLAHFTSYPNP